ncbi:MAG TPA: glycosyltransferase [Candidatus Omnitrophota bacterium]|nr:glycosyltransferase [Candidatus Omnitrophota bacterium]
MVRVLIVHATAGAGHQKAAEAILHGLKNHTPYDVSLLDILDYSSPLFKSLYRKTYFLLISKFPQVWAFFFGLLDVPFLQPLVRWARRLYNALNVGKFHKLLIEGQYDCVISTHFMPTEIASALKRKGLIKSKLITVITDYDAHRIWISEGIDAYAVATDWTKNKVMSLGISEEKIHVTGIPTDEKFGKSVDVSDLKRKLGLQENVFTVLAATGSFGIGPIEDIIAGLNDAQTQIVVVCGHNEELFKRLEAKKNTLIKPLAYVDNMHELMAVSDVMVTKPGGLSISECLVSQLPMIFFSAIPGQETNNIKVLAEYGIGLKGFTVDEIIKHVQDLKSSRDQFLTTMKRIKDIARPNAVKDIIKLIG